MKLSFFMMPLHTPGRDYHTTLLEDIEAFKLADELGFEEGWIGEHYSCDIEQVSSTMMFLAHMAGQTKRMKLATGVLPLPLYHPVMSAAHIALLDHLCEGRLILGVGTGALGSDFEAFGMPDADRPSMMLDNLDIMKKIWTSDPPYDIAGKHWSVKLKDAHWPDLCVGPMPKPMQRPFPPLAMSISSPYSKSMRVAAQQGAMPVSANFVAGWVVATHWETYVDEMEKLGRTPNGDDWRVARSIFVADTDAEADTHVKEPGGAYDWYFDYMFQVYERMDAAKLLAPERDTPVEEITPASVRDSFTISGSVDTVVEKLLAFRKQVGPFGTLMMTAHDGANKAATHKSMRLLAEKVMPAVNERLAREDAAGSAA
ncbi:MAG: LLM class flavin-dependent oxidoreductase [Rhizobiales bacterium]|nr:LLM class flavin-dependent oxidoreductase [Hyphomicrobiales bacterium]MBA70684.1 LLM class flavin-dependent oxidoreductase [Hyphomicrobiales bacterium]